MASSQPPRVGEVGARTLWKSKAIPQLGLEANLEFEYRVYVLECRTPAGSRGPFYSGGTIPSSLLILLDPVHQVHHKDECCDNIGRFCTKAGRLRSGLFKDKDQIKTKIKDKDRNSVRSN